MLQRQGQLPPEEGGEGGPPRRPGTAVGGADGSGPGRGGRTGAPPRRTNVRRERTSPATFVREVRGELRRVAWPTRPEVINYSLIVLVTLVVLVTLIFVLDLAFAKSILFLFDTPE
jgi:preprotein translocase subunit SecE